MARTVAIRCHCGGRKINGTCSNPICNKRKHRQTDARRENSHQRGYDSDWEKLAKAFKIANPLCRCCKIKGKYRWTEVVDHIEPFHSPEGEVIESLRLDWDNLQSLCEHCHNSDKRTIEMEARRKGSKVAPLWTAYLQKLKDEDVSR